MDCTCPRCSSDHTQRLSTIYRNGVVTLNTETTAVGSIFAHSTTSGTQKSALAERHAPPAKRGYFLVPIILALLSLIGGIWGFCATLGAGAYLFYAIQYNRGEWRRRYANWEGSFLCMRCENLFMPQQWRN